MNEKTSIITLEIHKLVKPEQILRLIESARTVRNEALELLVTDEESFQDAKECAEKIKKMRTQIEWFRKQIVADPNKFIKKVNAVLRPAEQMCQEGKSHLDQQRAAWIAKTEAKAKAEDLRRQKISIAKGGDGSAIQPVIKPIAPGIKRSIPDIDALKRLGWKTIESISITWPDVPGVSFSVKDIGLDIYDSNAVPDKYRKLSFVD